MGVRLPLRLRGRPGGLRRRFAAGFAFAAFASRSFSRGAGFAFGLAAGFLSGFFAAFVVMCLGSFELLGCSMWRFLNVPGTGEPGELA